MAELVENALKASISACQIKPVYILFGDDGYLINHYENRIIEMTCGKDNDFDLQKFEREADLQAIYDALNQFSMIGGRKCVVLSDYNFESAQKDDFDRLIALASDNYEFSTLILVFEDIEFDTKHSAKARKLLSAAEKGGGCAVRLDHRDQRDLARMLIGGATKRGLKLDARVSEYMIEMCGTDINTLSSELEKVCRYASGDSITKADVDTACIKSVEASVYVYVTKLLSCDTLSAINVLNDLFYMRIEPMIILYTAASAFVDMARMNAAKKVHKSANDAAEDFLYPENRKFLLTRAAGNLKKFNDKKLDLCMEKILKADMLLKSYSYDSKIVLEQMTAEIIYIIANGEAIDKD